MHFATPVDPTRAVRPARWSGLLAVGAVMLLAGVSQAAQVTLSNLVKTYNGNAQSATVTTVPSNLKVIVTYAGSTDRPVNAGSYAVVVTVDDPVETGSATGTLVINKANQSITMPALPAKTYGDAPFSATATSNSGLPVAKWQSLDPAVATISPAGEITLTGAGQTSIVADFAENQNFKAGWRAIPLNVARAAGLLPTGTTTVTYNGSAHGIDPATLPAGLATQTTYRNLSAPTASTVPEVVFQNGPDTLDLSYFSVGVQAHNNWAMAKYAALGGTARKLHSCDVTLVSWARYDTSSPYGSKAWADANPSLVVIPTPGISIPGNSGGYFHPITLSFYEFDEDGTDEIFRLLTSKTVQAFIPWRPEKLENGFNYPYSGHAFRVSFDFPNGVVLPDRVWVAASFNSQSNGTQPVGVAGPYNSLNYANADGQQVGTTLFNTAEVFRDWNWQTFPDVGRGPMLRLRAVPADVSLVKPVNAGTYEVKTQAAAFAADGPSLSTLVIEKAPLTIHLDGLTQVRDGDPKPVAVDTTPAGIVTQVLYGTEESSSPPSGLGSYPVTVTSANPNYQGEVQGVLRIGDTFASWQEAEFADAGLPPELTELTGDADGDGLDNFLEYAAGLNPLDAGHPRPTRFEKDGDNLAFTYRRNPHALDLQYTIQQTTNPADSESWTPAAPLQQNAVDEEGGGQLIEALLEKPADPPAYFLRLKVSRPQQP
jgi:hypothetical protein